METITFYSYKGGVGRTLVVANVARYLARFGQKVFALDLDLEAPGLHYKLPPKGWDDTGPPRLGVVDYVHSFAVQNKDPGPLQDYVRPVEVPEGAGGSIYIMPAGDAPSATYAERFAEINWHGLFYSTAAQPPSSVPKGIPFFLEMKERIQAEYGPAFLLIDSRTGITEIGGVATSLLPDKVVCLLLHNKENLEGAREVLRSLRRLQRLPGQQPIEVVAAVGRIPEMEKREDEQAILENARAFLTEEAPDLLATLPVSEVFVLHSERELEVSESLRVGGQLTPAQSVLLRDYLRLFRSLIPADIIRPHISSLLDEIWSRLREDPDGAERDVMQVADSYPGPEVLREVIKFLRARRAGPDALLQAAYRSWQVSGRADDPTVWAVVKDSFRDAVSPREVPVPLDFLESVWLASGTQDPQMAMRLAGLYSRGDDDTKAAAILLQLISGGQAPPEMVVACLRYLGLSREWSAGFRLVEDFKPSLAPRSDFQVAWARLVVGKEDRSAAESLLKDERFDMGLVSSADLPTAARLVSLAERRAALEELLRSAFDRALRKGPSRELANVARAYELLDREDEFRLGLREHLGPEAAEDFLRELGAPHRRFLR